MFADQSQRKPRPFRAGDLVLVKSQSEILASLDEHGAREGLPFMPEMTPYCGRRIRVARRVEHVFIDHLQYVARLQNTVILEDLRCTGAKHGGCQMGCQLLWKEEWLAPAAGEPDVGSLPVIEGPLEALQTEQDGKLWCQATQLPLITSRLPWWDLGQYTRGLRAGNFTLVELAKTFGLLVLNKVRWWCGKEQLGMLSGPLKQTVHESLNLEPGEWVEVKSRDEIQATLDVHGKHRGMSFVPEMALYCGRRFRVAKRVERMIQEGTGQMRQLRDTVALETVTCMGLAQRRCPRGCFHLWREGWLRRVPAESLAESRSQFPTLPILDQPVASASDASVSA